MKSTPRLFLFGALILILLSTACGTPSTDTPTPTEVVSVTDTPVAVSTVETPTATATGGPSNVSAELVCALCVEQVPHALVTIPTAATVDVDASSGVTCSSVETVEDKQIVLCRGPKLSGVVTFDLNVCNAGTCAKHQVSLIDCAAVPTATPTDTLTPTPTLTMTGTLPATAAGTATDTPAAAASSTPTPAAASPTPTPTP